MIYQSIKIIPFVKKFSYFLSRHGNNRGVARDRSDSSSIEDRCGKQQRTGSGGHYAFHPETEAILNQQVNAEFTAFYCYLSMASYFGRVDVALPGCESYFTQMHDEEHEHALRCLSFIKLRGGKVKLLPIVPPEDQDWKSPLNAFKAALELEIDVTDKLVNVNAVATKHGDLSTGDFVVTNFIDDQMKSVSEITRFVNALSSIGDQSLSRFVFDKDLLDNYVSPEFNVLKREKSWHPKNK